MAKDAKAAKPKISMDEYQKIKAKRAQQKLKLTLPNLVKALIALPIAYALFLLIYFLVKLRFLSEH